MKHIQLFTFLVLCCFQSYADGIFEGFETGTQDPFNGTSSLTWIGDVGDFEITNSTWPSYVSFDFADSYAIRSKDRAVADTSTILVDISSAYSSNKRIRWEVYISGNSSDITTGSGAAIILFTNSNIIDDIESGHVNGYRLRLCDPSGISGWVDGLYLEKANGTAWIMIDSLHTTDDSNINQGWNIAIERDINGNWSWGYTNGVIGETVNLTESIVDNTYITGNYSGMLWYSASGVSDKFGFDNFKVDPYTPNLWKSEAVSSDWSVASNWDDGVVPLSSSNIQIEAGTNQPIITSNVNCGNLTLEAGANLTIDNGSALTVDGNFLLESNINGSASLIDNGDLNIVGSSNIKQFMKCYDPTANNEYHFLSIPVANHAVENSLLNYYVYPYDETQNSWTALSAGDQLLKGKGYSVYYSGSADHFVNFLGIPNTGDQLIPITASNFSGTSSSDNWNLIANPFPSPIDWDLVTKNNIESAIYIWKAESCTYASYVDGVGSNFNNDGIIPAMQGFFVHAISAGNLTIPQTARVHNQTQDFLKNVTTSSQLRICIKDQNYADECLIRLKSGATEYFDAEYDALKFLSTKEEVAQLFSLINQEMKTSINSLSPLFDRYEIPLVSKTDIGGTYDICISNVSTMNQEYEIFLKDKISGVQFEITKDSCYQMNLVEGEIEQFTLIIDQKKMHIPEDDDHIIITVFQDGKIEIENISQSFIGGEVNVVAMDGREIFSAEITKSSMHFSITQRGLCIIKLISSQKVFTRKIIVL